MKIWCPRLENLSTIARLIYWALLDIFEGAPQASLSFRIDAGARVAGGALASVNSDCTIHGSVLVCVSLLCTPSMLRVPPYCMPGKST